MKLIGHIYRIPKGRVDIRNRILRKLLDKKYIVRKESSAYRIEVFEEQGVATINALGRIDVYNSPTLDNFFQDFNSPKEEEITA